MIFSFGDKSSFRICDISVFMR